jgi:hypothetical protein
MFYLGNSCVVGVVTWLTNRGDILKSLDVQDADATCRTADTRSIHVSYEFNCTQRVELQHFCCCGL